MKIKELLEILNECPDDYEVVMSSDGEGNSYSPLAGFDVCQYRPDSTWSGDLVDEDNLEEDEEYTPNSVVLFPTN